MMGRLIFPPFLLTLVYALALGSFAPADLALGAVLRGGLPRGEGDLLVGAALPYLADALVVFGVVVMNVGVYGPIWRSSPRRPRATRPSSFAGPRSRPSS